MQALNGPWLAIEQARNPASRGGLALLAALPWMVVVPALAQDTSVGGASIAEQTAAAPWTFSVTPYAWAINVDGKAGMAAYEPDVDVSFSDLIKDVNGALMLDLELRKGRFGIIADTVFARVEDDRSFLGGDVNIKAQSSQFIQSLAGTYRVGTWQFADFGEWGPLSVAVDLYAGLRYTYLNLELKGKLDVPQLGIDAHRSVKGDEHWVDPLVGLRTIFNLGDRATFIASGNVGGTGSSEYSWEAFGALGYRFDLFGHRNADFLLGYKALHQKYSDGDGPSAFKWDVTMHGPAVGLAITF